MGLPCRGAPFRAENGARSPVDVVLTWSLRSSDSRAPGAVLWAVACASSTRISFAVSPAAPAGGRLHTSTEEARVMRVDIDEGEIIERVAALDVGKAEAVCCVRVPGSTATRVGGLPAAPRLPPGAWGLAGFLAPS